MTKEHWMDIINHQVKLLLDEKGLKISDLNSLELLKYKFDMAVDLLMELK